MAADPTLDATRVGTRGVVRFGLYAGLGVVIGAGVIALEWVTIEQLLERLLEAPLAVQMIVPGLGLVVTAIVLRIPPHTDPATSDEYVRSFHTGRRLELPVLVPKLLGSIATIGSGGAVGLEGPSIYMGATLGQSLGRRRWESIGRRSQRIFLVAGAAAGVAAVFKAPATGVLFALESPYRRDLARHALIPALVASAAAYLTFVIVLGTDPLLSIASTEVGLRDEVAGAIVLGILGGLTARLMARILRWAKVIAGRRRLRYRLPVAALVAAVAVLAADALVDLPVTLGPGAEMVASIVQDPGVSLWTIAALFVLRGAATTATVGAGGVGGVFIPLVVQGLLLGRLVEGWFDSSAGGLYPVVGLAAVLGAGYRTPLASVVFVAETTGRAEFVIPALLATAISQSLMGEDTVSAGQVSERQGRLERRLDQPALEVAVTGTGTIRPDDSLMAVVDRYADQPSAPAVPVGEPGYLGLLVLHDVAPTMLSVGPEATVADAMRTVPAVHETAPAIDAARRMAESDTVAVAVVNDEGAPVGVITAMSLAGLRDLPE